MLGIAIAMFSPGPLELAIIFGDCAARIWCKATP